MVGRAVDSNREMEQQHKDAGRRKSGEYKEKVEDIKKGRVEGGVVREGRREK